MCNKKILIVEDNPDVSRGYHILLKAKNFDTFFAKDSSQGLWEAHKHRPDLIILDLGLPTPGDGFRTIKHLKAASHLEAIPILVVSGLNPHVVKECALRCGASAYLLKPADNTQLLTVISQLIGKSGGGELQAALELQPVSPVVEEPAKQRKDEGHMDSRRWTLTTTGTRFLGPRTRVEALPAPSI
jgi:two-component system alkaline phosphatase synthesis response regulator PhoP